ncbi:MAG: SDR family oxidoreductase [Candidatus Latescibacteria bacterium]|nr:SDR family oxidoreductase [Candidatus Latescibacterota bacterium]
MNILDMFSLKGKVVLITGGAGLYGKQIVSACAEAGAEVVIASRNLEALEKIAKQYRNSGYTVTAYRVDLGEEKSVLDLKNFIEGKCGRLDALINNAVARPMKGYTDDMSSFEESMHINATGLFIVTRIMGDFIAETEGGSILNIGSIMGMIGPDPTNYTGTSMNAWYPDYFFHKGGMINFTRFIASYYSDKGIRCNCVSPGGLFQPTMPEAFVKNYSSRTLLGRLANDTDLKGIIVFLVSDASVYITGANIPVDGGYTAK